MIVYKVLFKQDDRLFSTNKSSEAANCLRDLVIEYKKDIDNEGLVIDGQKTLLFAFNCESAAREWFKASHLNTLRDYKKASLWKCSASNVSNLIRPLMNSMHVDYFNKQVANYWKNISIIRKKKKSISSFLDKNSSMLLKNRLTNCVACEKIRLLEEIDL